MSRRNLFELMGTLLLGALLTLMLMPNQAHAEPPLLELNDASLAELESLPGIGPALAERLLIARTQAPFDNWTDLQRRVRGIGPSLAGRLSAAGLRVRGLPYGEPGLAEPGKVKPATETKPALKPALKLPLESTLEPPP